MEQLESVWEELLTELPRLPVLLCPPPPLPTPNYAISLYIIPIYASPNPNSLPFKIVLTLKLFSIVLPNLYVIIEALCGPLYH